MKNVANIFTIFILIIFSFYATAVNLDTNIVTSQKGIEKKNSPFYLWQCLNQRFNQPNTETISIDDILQTVHECFGSRRRSGKSLQKIIQYFKGLFKITREKEITFNWEFLIKNRGSIILFVSTMEEENSDELDNMNEDSEYYYFPYEV